MFSNGNFYRPGNAKETVSNLFSSVTCNEGPTSLIFLRQNLDENNALSVKEQHFVGQFCLHQQQQQIPLSTSRSSTFGPLDQGGSPSQNRSQQPHQTEFRSGFELDGRSVASATATAAKVICKRRVEIINASCINI